MDPRHVLTLGSVLVVALAACSSPASPTTTSARTTPPASDGATRTPDTQDVMELPPFAPIEPGTYLIDPDLATGLASLAPLEVTSPPQDVVVDHYSGKHLTLTVPKLPMQGQGDDSRFTGCVDGILKSWVAAIDAAEPGDAFYGYTGPGYVEEIWILDVEGTRLMIAAEQSPRSQPRDLAELHALVDSIRIDPLA